MAAILLGIHIQGIAVIDIATCWFFTKNAAGNSTMIYNGH